MTIELSLPDGPIARASLTIAQEQTSQPLVDHCVRTFLFARLIAQQEGADRDTEYDENLLFAATVMHDLGLSDSASADARFEVVGADMAVPLLTQLGVPDSDIDRVWEAIALHSTPGIAARRGLLTYLTHFGVALDAGHPGKTLPPEQQAAVNHAWPRPPGDTSVPDAIIKHASRSPAARPPFTISAELHRLSLEADESSKRRER